MMASAFQPTNNDARRHTNTNISRHGHGNGASNEKYSTFVKKLSTDYNSTIPESVVQHYLARSGVSCKDPNIVKYVALAADKFLAECIHDTFQEYQIRKQANKASKRKSQEEEATLEVEDLSVVLKKKRIDLNRRCKLEK